MPLTFVVAQLGARMHYAVPRILAACARLEMFYTDFCAAKGLGRLLGLIPPVCRPEIVKRALTRIPQSVPLEKISSLDTFGWQYARRLRRATTREQTLQTHLWAGTTFCKRVLARGIPENAGVYTFNSAGLELLEATRKRGNAAVLEQTIAPFAFQHRLLCEEAEKFPGWEPYPDTGFHAREYEHREAAEWNAAHQIICGSEFVRNGIAAVGGPARRCIVVPYGVDLPACGPAPEPAPAHTPNSPPRFKGKRPLRVLTAGAVGLRKGSPYILEAARRLHGKAEFRLTGAITVTPHARHQLSQHVEMTGAVPRSEMPAHYHWADLFLLPSICEGSATVTYEAMAYGLPVICTPNTGSVIRDGLEGFLIPASNSDAIIHCIEKLASDPDLLETLAERALNRAREFTLETYAARLIAALGLN